MLSRRAEAEARPDRSAVAGPRRRPGRPSRARVLYFHRLAAVFFLFFVPRSLCRAAFIRYLQSSKHLNMVKILAVLYRGGEHAKSQPKLLGTIENKLGFADWLKEQGHEYVVGSKCSIACSYDSNHVFQVTDDKEGPNSEFQKQIVDAEVLITLVSLLKTKRPS